MHLKRYGNCTRKEFISAINRENPKDRAGIGKTATLAMTAAIATPISQIELTSGSAIRINGVTWEGYIPLLKRLGDKRLTRIADDNTDLFRP